MTSGWCVNDRDEGGKVKIPTATRNAACQALVSLFNAGAGPGYLEIRTGAGPAGPNDAANGTLLATVVLADPAFDTAGTTGAGIAVAGSIAVVQGVGNGDAGWFRAYDSNGTAVEDGTCSAAGGGGELELNTVTISVGVDVAVTGWSINMPES
jgi:hypothetical protein